MSYNIGNILSRMYGGAKSGGGMLYEGAQRAGENFMSNFRHERNRSGMEDFEKKLKENKNLFGQNQQFYQSHGVEPMAHGYIKNRIFNPELSRTRTLTDALRKSGHQPSGQEDTRMSLQQQADSSLSQKRPNPLQYYTPIQELQQEAPQGPQLTEQPVYKIPSDIARTQPANKQVLPTSSMTASHRQLPPQQHMLQQMTPQQQHMLQMQHLQYMQQMQHLQQRMNMQNQMRQVPKQQQQNDQFKENYSNRTIVNNSLKIMTQVNQMTSGSIPKSEQEEIFNQLVLHNGDARSIPYSMFNSFSPKAQNILNQIQNPVSERK